MTGAHGQAGRGFDSRRAPRAMVDNEGKQDEMSERLKRVGNVLMIDAGGVGTVPGDDAELWAVVEDVAYRRGRREAIEEAARHLNEINLPTHARTAALAIVAHEAELTKGPARGQ